MLLEARAPHSPALRINYSGTVSTHERHTMHEKKKRTKRFIVSVRGDLGFTAVETNFVYMHLQCVQYSQCLRVEVYSICLLGSTVQ